MPTEVNTKPTEAQKAQWRENEEKNINERWVRRGIIITMIAIQVGLIIYWASLGFPTPH